MAEKTIRVFVQIQTRDSEPELTLLHAQVRSDPRFVIVTSISKAHIAIVNDSHAAAVLRDSGPRIFAVAFSSAWGSPSTLLPDNTYRVDPEAKKDSGMSLDEVVRQWELLNKKS